MTSRPTVPAPESGTGLSGADSAGTPVGDGYTLWAVLRRNPAQPVDPMQTGIDAGMQAVAELGVTLRGFYDVSGLRADADLLIWLHGGAPEDLQKAFRALTRAGLLSTMIPQWNALGVHRDAEFSRSHSPAYLRGEEPKRWVTVYPFVRSYEWYLLPDEERRGMLASHGRKGAEFPQVLSNTVASFALGDYEWILALEADELVDLVDLMRHLRQTDARRHVREEVPFFTGRRIDVSELLDVIA
jgi:chlorite dismutase